MRTSFVSTCASIGFAASLVATAQADPIVIHENDAVHIVFQTDLRADVNRPGDLFSVKVEHDPLLPDGTTLYGRIQRVHFATPNRAAALDMVFTSFVTPKGDRRWIDAVPAPENDPHLVHGTDGRLIAAYKPGEDSAYAFGGTVGGLILGGIGHRPILGGVIGGLIGAIAGSEDRRQNANLVVRKGAKMVAVFEHDSSDQPPVDRGGWRVREGSRPGPGSPPPGPPPSGPPVGPVDIRVNGTPLSYTDNSPFMEGGDLLVPLESTADQIGLATAIHDNGDITIDGPQQSVQLRQDSNSYRFNGAGSTLKHKVVTRDGVVYVPIEAFSQIAGDPITVNGSRVGLK